MSFAWKGSIGPPVRKASKILESKAGNFPYGIVISSLPPFSNLWKMEFVFKKEKGKKRIPNQSAFEQRRSRKRRVVSLFFEWNLKKEKRKERERERERERKEGRKEEKKFQGERMKNGKSWWSRFCRRIKEGGNIAGEYCFRLFALKSDKSPDKKLSYPKREFQSSLTLPVGEVWRWKICAKLGLTKRESRGEKERGENSLSQSRLLDRQFVTKFSDVSKDNRRGGGEESTPRNRLFFYFSFIFIPRWTYILLG